MPPKGDGVNSIIGQGSIFEGKYHVNGAIQIDGKFDGELFAEQQIIVGETGIVKTESLLKSQRIIIAGSVLGDIVAEESISLLESSRVIGNIVTPYLQVEKGVMFDGHLKITADSSQDFKKIIEAEFQNSQKEIPHNTSKNDTEDSE